MGAIQEAVASILSAAAALPATAPSHYGWGRRCDAWKRPPAASTARLPTMAITTAGATIARVVKVVAFEHCDRAKVCPHCGIWRMHLYYHVPTPLGVPEEYRCQGVQPPCVCCSPFVDWCAASEVYYEDLNVH